MYCRSCGKETPANSQFCSHCGTLVTVHKSATAALHRPVQWEYKDYIYNWPRGHIWANVGQKGYTLPATRLEFWSDSQRQIRSELQKWLDDGWEPVGEVGPTGIQVREYSSIKASPFGMVIIIGLSLVTIGLALPAFFDRYAEPTVFSVQMRRPKA